MCTHRSGRGGRRFKSCHSDQLHTQAAAIHASVLSGSAFWRVSICLTVRRGSIAGELQGPQALYSGRPKFASFFR